MSWVMVAMAVGSYVVGDIEQNKVAKQQDNQVAEQLRQQYATKQKVAARTAALIQQQQGMTDKPQETAAAKQYQTALQNNQQQAVQPLQMAGNVSQAYKKAGADAAQGISTYGTNLGNLTAAIDAPTQERRDNQKNLDNYQLDVNTLNRNQQGQDFLDQMKLNSIHANPWVGLLTAAGRAYAGAKLASGNGSDPWSNPTPNPWDVGGIAPYIDTSNPNPGGYSFVGNAISKGTPFSFYPNS